MIATAIPSRRRTPLSRRASLLALRYSMLIALILWMAAMSVAACGVSPAPALVTSGQPWLSPATRTALLDYATRAPASTAANRQQRQRVLLVMALAGPDTHVM